jgi:hypothetical protein
MKFRVCPIIVFFIAVVISQKTNAQENTAISLIYSDIFFQWTEVTESSPKFDFRSRNSSPAFSYHTNDYYSLKLFIKINENIEGPLDIKLSSAKGKENIYRLEENIDLLSEDEIYDYNLEIILEETGWYKIEIGDFTKNENGINTNLVFDESTVYVRK